MKTLVNDWWPKDLKDFNCVFFPLHNAALKFRHMRIWTHFFQSWKMNSNVCLFRYWDFLQCMVWHWWAPHSMKKQNTAKWEKLFSNFQRTVKKYFTQSDVSEHQAGAQTAISRLTKPQSLLCNSRPKSCAATSCRNLNRVNPPFPPTPLPPRADSRSLRSNRRGTLQQCCAEAPPFRYIVQLKFTADKTGRIQSSSCFLPVERKENEGCLM